MSILFAVIGLVALVMLAQAVRLSVRPVSRAQVETFARRQHLTITAANGVLIVRSLGLTRRWRTLGLWTGIVCGFLWALQDAEVTLNFTAAFLGWFVGAVIAEWRLAGLPRDSGPRSASLERRTVSRYLSRSAQVVLGLALLVLAVSCVAVLLRAGATDGAVTLRALVWISATSLGLVLVGLTLRRVATRPQPPSAPDLVAADDALRARAANVLAGSVIAAAGLPTAAMFELIGAQVGGDRAGWASAGLAVLLLELVLGFLVATSASPATRRPLPSERVAAER